MWRHTANKVIQEEIREGEIRRRKLGQNLCQRMSSLVLCAPRSSANVAENSKILDNVQNNLTNLSNKDFSKNFLVLCSFVKERGNNYLFNIGEDWVVRSSLFWSEIELFFLDAIESVGIGFGASDEHSASTMFISCVRTYPSCLSIRQIKRKKIPGRFSLLIPSPHDPWIMGRCVRTSETSKIKR